MKAHFLFKFLSLLLWPIFSNFGGDLLFTKDPSSQMALGNDFVKFSSQATSSLAISYQWFKGTTPIPGASDRDLTFQVFDESDSGLYKVRAQTTADTVFSRAADLQVFARPIVSITAPTNGANLAAEVMQTLSASITPEVAGAITNVSFYNGATLLGSATTQPFQITLSLPVGDYALRAIAQTSWGASDTSGPVAFGVASAQVKITRQPLSQEVLLGRTIQFRSEGGGATAVTYQWLKDGEFIPGATSATLSLTVSNTAQAGSYRMRASNASGATDSAEARLVVQSTAPDWRKAFWRALPAEPGELYRGIASGNGVLVAVGERGYVAVSTDGLEWTDLSPTFRDNLTKVRFLNGRFWATSEAGVILRSDDGWNWTRILTGVSWTFADIAFNFKAGRFVAVPTNGFPPIYSADGNTWVRATTSFDSGASRIVSGDGLFVALGGFNSNIAYVSTDGDVWTVHAIETPLNTCLDLAFFNGNFIAIRSGGIHISPDGKTWQRRLSGAAADFQCAVASPTRLTVLGQKVAQSTDGLNFSLVSATPPNLYAAIYTGSVYYGLGILTDNASRGFIAGSINGLGWSRLEPAPPPLAVPPRVRFANDQFFILGNNAIAYGDGSDGWSRRATLRGIDGFEAFSGIAYHAGRYLSPNRFPATINRQIWASGDNLDFSPLSSAPGLVSDIIFADGEFIVIGNNSWVSRSADGTAWTSTSVGAATLRVVAKANHRIVVGGNEGKIFISENNAPWAQVSSGTTGLIQGAVFGEGLFVVVGNGVLQYSTDGREWFPAQKSFSTELTQVAYGDGLFIASGNGGTIGFSWDGQNWEQAQLHTAPDLFGVAYGNGRWVLQGRNGAILQTGPRPGAVPLSLAGSIVGGKLQVQITANPGRIVRVETSPDLALGAWELRDRFLTGSEPALRAFDVSGSSPLFVRALEE